MRREELRGKAREAAADERDRAADEREEVADEREEVADRREEVADERDRVADEREEVADRREVTAGKGDFVANEREARAERQDWEARRRSLFDQDLARVRRLLEQGDGFRAQLADAAERIADGAEHVAAVLEEHASHGANHHRMRLAETEREIARIERRNAARLREARQGPLNLERLPELPRREAGPSPSTVEPS